MILLSKIKETFNVDVATSANMDLTIINAFNTYKGKPDWIDVEDDIKTINFAKALCSETARLAMMGTKITIDDGSITHTYRKVDEARIREADVKENIRLRELAIEEKKLEAKENTKRQKVKATIILGMIGLLCFFIASIGGIFGLGPIGIVGFILFAFIAKMWFFKK